MAAPAASDVDWDSSWSPWPKSSTKGEPRFFALQGSAGGYGDIGVLEAANVEPTSSVP